LAVLGRIELLSRPMISVIGARNASANGRRVARDLAGSLGRAGLVVTSGLARGIDAEAHLGAIHTGTVAVQAGGVDIVYPAENRGLYEAILGQGVVIAELPLGSEPRARDFPRRNRIISGMALGVVVVEAAAHSGSLITARLALEQEREIFAVPGSPLDPRCRGANDLLRRGATLVETAEDVIAQLGPLLQLEVPRQPAPTTVHTSNLPIPAIGGLVEPVADDAGLDLVLRLLGPTPVPVDELVRQCQLTAAAVATFVLELELAGRVERHPGNLVSLR
jgi:DNA processing protein